MDTISVSYDLKWQIKRKEDEEYTMFPEIDFKVLCSLPVNGRNIITTKTITKR
jgi:hypothetical protein